jgi:hypothetical protein
LRVEWNPIFIQVNLRGLQRNVITEVYQNLNERDFWSFGEQKSGHQGKRDDIPTQKPVHIQNFRPRNQGSTIEMILNKFKNSRAWSPPQN